MYVVLMFRKLTELITHPLHESCLEELTVGNNPLIAQLSQFWKFGTCSSWKYLVFFPSFFFLSVFFLMNVFSCLQMSSVFLTFTF